MLDRAIQIAVQAHAGQKDKGGNPYILHPIRVMMSVSGINEKIVAILHDVVEDSDWTFDALLKEGFSSEIIEALKSVTKTSEQEDYESFIRRAKANAIGRQVKIADLKDNLDVTRIPELSDKDIQRIDKYMRALKQLNDTARRPNFDVEAADERVENHINSEEGQERMKRLLSHLKNTK
jgi:predicted Zn-ribbon and HTH transcriptional regulator